MQTLPLALVTFRSAYGDIDYGVVMASTVLAVTPPLLVFLSPSASSSKESAAPD